MDPDELNDELAFALDLAVEAGRIGLHYWRGGTRALRVRDKPAGGGPVTQADLDVDALCVGAIERRFTEDDVVAEESHHPDRPIVARRRWYIDPIDGTRDFAHGRPGWAVLIGLCIDERPVLGVVHEPVAGWTGWALDHGGHRLACATTGTPPEGPSDPRARPLRTSSRPPGQAILIGGRIFPLSRQYAVRRALGIAPERTRSIGSVGIRMSMVARGDADVYVQAPGRTKGWDTCGPSVLLSAAGAAVTDFLGQPLTYPAGSVSHPRGLVVSRAEDHADVLRSLAPLTARWLPAEPGRAVQAAKS